MLTAKDNELLTRVGPGTPMGDLVRLYWVPLLFSSELAEPDGPPLRTRLFGEDLIAFRESSGRVGLVADNCPHRGASLFFGRNEEGGLRCVYHGWKFDTSGACLDMPNEPAESNFKAKVRVTAYACAERNGVVWAYLGPQSPPPPLPAIEWNLVPQSHVHLSKRVATNNWVQALEGEIDSSHAGFLHSRLDKSQWSVSGDRSPRFETVDTEYGVAIASRRDAQPDTYLWRVNQFVLPFWTVVPPDSRNETISGHAWIPIDDTSTLCFMFTYHPTKPLEPRWRDILAHGRYGREPGHLSEEGALPATSAPHGAFRPRLNWSNDFGLDRGVEAVYYSGLPGIWPQDSGCQESMGPIYNRSKEHLGSSDAGIIRMRRALLAAARALRERGATPGGATDPEVFRVRSVAIELPRSQPWMQGVQPHIKAGGAYRYPIPV